jgi:hypothetical protein
MLGARTLRGGKASLRTTSLPLGRDAIQVMYAGGSSAIASKATIIENVKAPRTNAKPAEAPAIVPRRRDAPATAAANEGNRPADPAADFTIASPVLGPITLEESTLELGIVNFGRARVARMPSAGGAALVAGGAPPRKRPVNDRKRQATPDEGGVESDERARVN